MISAIIDSANSFKLSFSIENDSVKKDLPNPLIIDQSNNQYYQPELI